METSSLVQTLEWDSEFFQHRIGRILPEVLSEQSWAEIVSWQRANQIECLYFLTDGNDRQTLRLAEASGFFLTDIRITLENSGLRGDAPPVPGVRPFQPQDLEALRSIARISHRDSRFYFDPHFSQEQCDRLYDVWIDKSCHGYADVTLVAEVEGKAAGYITNHFDEQEGRIGLVGVDPACQGKGLGKALVAASLRLFAERGYKTVTVVTQGRNIRAQRLYQKNGFMTHSLRLWYHWWVKPAVSKE